MLVKALRMGYYNEKRQPADSIFKLVDKKVFKLVEEKNKKTGKLEKVKKFEVLKASAQFSEKWMEVVDESDVKKEVVERAEAFAESQAAIQNADVI